MFNNIQSHNLNVSIVFKVTIKKLKNDPTATCLIRPERLFVNDNKNWFMYQHKNKNKNKNKNFSHFTQFTKFLVKCHFKSFRWNCSWKGCFEERTDGRQSKHFQRLSNFKSFFKSENKNKEDLTDTHSDKFKNAISSFVIFDSTTLVSFFFTKNLLLEKCVFVY
jgi:hypothetical protein